MDELMTGERTSPARSPLTPPISIAHPRVVWNAESCPPPVGRNIPALNAAER